MKFLIAPNDNIISVDNAVANVDCSSLGITSNVRFIVWDTAEGGRYEYNDRASIHVQLNDPSFAESALNLWMAAQQFASPPLTLDQAKLIKVQLIDGIYNARRQNAITFQGHQYDATDEAFDSLRAALLPWDSPAAIVAAVNIGFANLANGVATTFAANDAHINSSFDNISAQVNGASISTTTPGYLTSLTWTYNKTLFTTNGVLGLNQYTYDGGKTYVSHWFLQTNNGSMVGVQSADPNTCSTSLNGPGCYSSMDAILGVNVAAPAGITWVSIPVPTTTIHWPDALGQ